MFRALFAVALGLSAAPAGAGVNVWTSSGPPGYVFLLAVDSANLTLYAGSRLDATRTVVFRSSDHGASWAESGEAPASTYLSAIGVSPTTPFTVYAAVNSGPYGGTVYRSADAGSSWGQVGSLFQHNLWGFAFSKDRPGTLYGAGSDCYCVGVPCFYRIQCSAAVLKSEDSGMNWRLLADRLSGTKATSVALDRVEQNRIYAAGDGGFFVSFDGGSHWIGSNSGLEGCSSVRALELLSDGTLWIATASNQTGSFSCGGLFRSTDGARTWTPIGPPTQLATSLAVDPTNPRVIYVGTSNGTGIFRSEDGGETWAAFGSIPGSPDVLEIVVEPSGRFIHAGTSAGVFDYEIVPGARPPVVPPRERETRTVPPRP
jgi:photosystem II stability/assembly factor-like uncharacterized protein